MSSQPPEIQSDLPERLVVLPAEEVLFPTLVLPIALNADRQKELLEAAGPSGLVAVTVRSDASTPTDSEQSTHETEEREVTPGLYDTGSVGRILRNVRLPGRRQGLMIAGVRRIKIDRYFMSHGRLMADVKYPDEHIRSSKRVDALMRNVRSAINELTAISRWTPEDIGRAAADLDEPGQLADFIAASLAIPVEERQSLLATMGIDERLRRVLGLLLRETDLARLGEKVQDEIRIKVEKSQRERYLRAQLTQIRTELGEEVDEKELELKKIEERLAELPESVQERGTRELNKAQMLPSETSEYYMVRTYLDWLVDLPWEKCTEDAGDIAKAAAVLNRSHFGLKEVKERIIEFLAVRKLKPKREGAILCLVGPPGVGKTSLGQAIANALGRRFCRMALGGLRDEAEIRGHRITYIGAMPGRVLQAMRRVNSNNPVFMLDEVDKVGADWRSDPSHALLELLDPAQNQKFTDHYLDLPFDLSKVLFVATANVEEDIHHALRDRMEFIRIPGYVEAEKLTIAARYLVPRQRRAHGLHANQLRVGPKTLRKIIDSYAQEAGVRELERQVGRICRKVAADIALGHRNASTRTEITGEHLEKLLGPRRYARETELRTRNPGVAVGLAWTPNGGSILFVESAVVPGKGRLRLTGLVGKVMNESAAIALSHVRANANLYGIDQKILTRHDVHIHIPEGAVPKDGPSAGITIAAALISLLRRGGKGHIIRPKIAMTGELTISGAILSVGGVKEKVIAAQRAGIKMVLLPNTNDSDIRAMEPQLRRGLTIGYVRNMVEVVDIVFGKKTPDSIEAALTALTDFERPSG